MQKETYDRVKSAFVDRLHLMKQTTRTMTPNRARMTARATRPFFLVLEVEDLMLGSEDPSTDWVGGGLVGISFQESKAEPFLGTSAAAMVTVAVDRVVEAEGVGDVVEETWVGGWAAEVSLVTLSSSASKSAIAVSRFSVVSPTSAAVVSVAVVSVAVASLASVAKEALVSVALASVAKEAVVSVALASVAKEAMLAMAAILAMAHMAVMVNSSQAILSLARITDTDHTDIE